MPVVSLTLILRLVGKGVATTVKDSTTTKRKTKHAKLLPYVDFPLSPHVPIGRWYKVIRGTRHYFGKIGNWKAALGLYQRQRDDLYAGRTPSVTLDASVSV